MKKANKTNKARAMRLVPFSRSPVSIIIPFHGEYERVGRLVSSIWNATRSNPYEICLVDDCSPNSDFIASMKDQPQVMNLRTPERIGFGGALKYGFDRTEQPWVCFLNSDCEIQDVNWLIAMGQSLLDLKEQGVRMVSSRTNNPGNLGDKRLKGKKGDFINDVILEDTYLPLYCSMCHRDLFNHIGGFIKPYPYGWYEDEELAYRMRHYGFKQAISGKSWVHHEGSVTVKTVLKNDLKAKEIMNSNRDKCIADISSL